MIGILLIILAVIGFSSWFIANRVYKGLQRNENDNAMVWSVLTFILSFAVLSAAVFFLIIYNIRIER